MSDDDAPEVEVPVVEALPDAQRVQAMARFAVLRPHLHDAVTLAASARHAGVPVPGGVPAGHLALRS